jgi:hypothetical protein
MFVMWQEGGLREVMYAWSDLAMQCTQAETTRVRNMSKFRANAFNTWVAMHSDCVYVSKVMRVVVSTWRKVWMDDVLRHWWYTVQVMKRFREVQGAYQKGLIQGVSCCYYTCEYVCICVCVCVCMVVHCPGHEEV